MRVSKKKFYLGYHYIFSLIGALLLMYVAFELYLLTSLRTDFKCIIVSLSQKELCQSDRSYTKFRDLPKHLVESLLISEDIRFYEHDGFDWDEIKNSLKKNIQEKRFARGGSTLTQQLAKNLYLSKEKSLWRKVKEAYIAYFLERNLSKTKILEIYFNVVEFGKDIYGIHKASYFYFLKHPSQLSVTESAYLIHLLPNPISYSKGFFEKNLRERSHFRMNLILTRLFKFKRISSELYSEAMTQYRVDFSPPELKLEEMNASMEDAEEDDEGSQLESELESNAMPTDETLATDPQVNFDDQPTSESSSMPQELPPPITDEIKTEDLNLNIDSDELK